MFKNIILTEEEEKDYWHEAAQNNVRFGKILMLVVGFFELCMIVYAAVSWNLTSTRSLVYFISYIFLFALCAAGLYVTIKHSKKKCYSDNFLITVSTIFVSLIIIWSLLISVLDSRDAYVPLVYLTVLMAVTSAVVIKPQAQIVIQIASFLTLIVVTIFYDQVTFDFNQLINAIVFFVIVILIGRVQYNNSITQFRSVRKYKEQTITLSEFNDRLQKSYECLEMMSNVDVLTGVFNRLKFNKDINALIDECREEKVMFNCAMVDIDNFKKINDTYGHLEGDKCLIAFARIFKQREDLRVYRIGGEEFIILAKGMDKAAFKEFVEKSRIESADKYDLPVNVTFSSGIYCTVPDEQETADNVLHNVDKTLYYAKEHGKNRTVEYNEELFA